jgi:hypothetical protein
VGGQRHAPAALPPGKTLYLLYCRLGGRHGRSGQVRKVSTPPGFGPSGIEPATFRFVAQPLRHRVGLAVVVKHFSTNRLSYDADVFWGITVRRAASVVCWLAAGLWYPSSRVQTRPKPSDFSGEKIPQRAFLRRGSKAVCPTSQLCGMLKNPAITWKSDCLAKFDR